jgi:hypothetical protein
MRGMQQFGLRGGLPKCSDEAMRAGGSMDGTIAKMHRNWLKILLLSGKCFRTPELR